MDLYLAVVEKEVSVILIREMNVRQSLVCFISKAIAGAQNEYQIIEKVSLAMVVASRKLI